MTKGFQRARNTLEADEVACVAVVDDGLLVESQIEIRGPGVGVDRVWRRIAAPLSQYPFTIVAYPGIRRENGVALTFLSQRSRIDEIY